MLVLGICGGLDPVHDNLHCSQPWRGHDSASVLIEDGKLVSAIEEERLNRIKHTNKFPVKAIVHCLESTGARLEDIDLISYYSCEQSIKHGIGKIYLADSRADDPLDPHALLTDIIRRELGCEISRERLRFVHHHLAHAMSAFALSGYDSSLVTTFDGVGDDSSGMVLLGEGLNVTPLVSFPWFKSLGQFYESVISYLGYSLHDEYKVMGLAPYGDPKVYRPLFKSFHTLLPKGDYFIHKDRIYSLFDLGAPRRKWEPFTQMHCDLAASLQEALEEIVFHVLRHFRKATGKKNLCMAGGVAHNCTLNGKVLESGLFDNVFVQPAAHDAGGALGAALHSYYSTDKRAPKTLQMNHVYWGTDIGSTTSILEVLTSWSEFVSYQRVQDICGRTAELLAKGHVVAWVQGRSEFGPRALGNRSILADPRPFENKERINRMVKKREGYRPFAPSVLEEYAKDFFVIPNQVKSLPFMVFVVPVRKEKQALLGAVTHVDGTARVQTVSKTTNAKFWQLINAFMRLTGVPVLLNTSFNNNVEPIVNSIEDSLACFLTTKIDYLVVDDYLVERRSSDWRAYTQLKPSLPAHLSLHRVKKVNSKGRRGDAYFIGNSYDAVDMKEISEDLFRIIEHADSGRTTASLLEEVYKSENGNYRAISDELLDLWSQRLVQLRP